MNVPPIHVAGPEADAERTRRSAREFLAGALNHMAGRDRPIIVTLPAPLARPASLLELLPQAPAFLWQAPYGRAVAGSGAAARLEATGDNRIASIREQAESWSSRLLRLDHPDAPEVPARFFGGMSFDSSSEPSDAWRGFPDAGFILPRWSYEREGSRACLRLVLARAPERRTGDYLDELDSLLRGLETDRDPHPLRTGTITIAEPDIEKWRRYVEDSRNVIRAGNLRKVVAARATTVECEHDIDPLALLARLGGEHGGSTVFSITFEEHGAVFLGATPETLVSLSGRRIAADPLAGSIAAPESAGSTGERERRAATLFASGKDRAEHALVVESVARSLKPEVSHLVIPAEPRIRADRHVMHLHTPIRGELERRAHVLEFLELLHPTPSVGGVPTDDAVAWIREREPCARGWYAGPVGWFDAAGDGEFAIAIRSGLVRGRTACVYAGAGIVSESDPAAEYEETVVKLRALMRALGIP